MELTILNTAERQCDPRECIYGMLTYGGEWRVPVQPRGEEHLHSGAEGVPVERRGIMGMSKGDNKNEGVLGERRRNCHIPGE